jgi:hypothetical protein
MKRFGYIIALLVMCGCSRSKDKEMGIEINATIKYLTINEAHTCRILYSYDIPTTIRGNLSMLRATKDTIWVTFDEDIDMISIDRVDLNFKVETSKNVEVQNKFVVTDFK